jgi:hypothetical protein
VIDFGDFSSWSQVGEVTFELPNKCRLIESFQHFPSLLQIGIPRSVKPDNSSSPASGNL